MGHPATHARFAAVGPRFRAMIRARDLDPEVLAEAARARRASPAANAELLAATADRGFVEDVDELLEAAGGWLAEADAAEEAADLFDRLNQLRRLLHELESSRPAPALRAA